MERIKGPMIYGCHPHGIFGLSTLINFGIGAQEEGESLKHFLKRPDSSSYNKILVLIPFWRICCLDSGWDRWIVPPAAIRWEIQSTASLLLLAERGSPKFRPGITNWSLNGGKGIFKLAIEENVPIVPVFSFGDVDLYHQIQLPWPVSLLQSLSIKWRDSLCRCQWPVWNNFTDEETTVYGYWPADSSEREKCWRVARGVQVTNTRNI